MSFLGHPDSEPHSDTLECLACHASPNASIPDCLSWTVTTPRHTAQRLPPHPSNKSSAHRLLNCVAFSLPSFQLHQIDHRCYDPFPVHRSAQGFPKNHNPLTPDTLPSPFLTHRSPLTSCIGGEKPVFLACEKFEKEVLNFKKQISPINLLTAINYHCEIPLQLYWILQKQYFRGEKFGIGVIQTPLFFLKK